MQKIRQVVAYKNYFEDFLLDQPLKVQDKIYKVLEAIETLERIPIAYLKFLVGTKGLYEARIRLGTDIWRVFCFFDQGRVVILLSGFVKKTQKTPRNEIDKAINLVNQNKNEEVNDSKDRHLKTFEGYHDDHLDSILDKINKSGMDSLSKIDKEFLDAYKDGDEEKMSYIEHIEGQRTFTSKRIL